MGEVKSVKVDNWGVFFLQKLQNFFNKTDYCDLTLQFRDNSQLKVHRLVLSACTDYFNVLEQTCEIVDDALIMPNEFQADVVVPIVNFMYTGTLEFELKMYGKLLRTAKEMNMTVLLKLLEAHRRTMENVNRSQRPPSPKGIRRNRGPMQISPQRTTGIQHTNRNTTSVQQQQQIRSGVTTTQRSPSSSLLRSNVSGGAQVPRSQYLSQYESTASGQTIIKQEQSTSPFEQLRKGYNNNKRPTTTSLLSPPAKKPNLEDVKEFAEQQRMRKQIAAEFGEDQEYEGIMDDDIHADDDDDELPQPQPSTSKNTEQTAQTTRVEHGGATIIFKQETPDQQPTIIVKDSSTTKLNHAKIIAEVLRQYPHLMKGQKNIKLKIMPNAQATPGQKVVKKDSGEMTGSNSSSPQKLLLGTQQSQRSILTTSNIKTTPAQTQTAHDPKLQVKEQSQQAAAATSALAPTTTTQKRRIDSKTMHSLIALGAENTTGPWLCLRCGVNNRPISIPSYRGFRRHLINTHKETIDPALCELCGWRSHDDRELHFHLQVDHATASTVYNFPECQFCNELFLKYEQLNMHLESEHANSKQQCIYCNRFFAKEMQLYTHMKTQHKEQALEDGIIDDTDEEYFGSQDEEQSPSKKETKVKIISDISLPIASPLVNTEATKIKTEASTVQELLQAASTSESEIKFVGPDGHEVHLTDEQRKEILAQLNQQEQGGVVMMLNEQEQDAADEQAAKADSDNITDVKSAETEESLGDDELNEEADADASSMAEDYDDSQIYNELNSQSAISEGKKSEGAHLDESKESVENLEWAENLISEHERETNNANEEKSKNPNLSDKLKEITGDWTEDENEDDVESCEQKTEHETPKEDTIQDVKEEPIVAQECESKQTVEKSEESVEAAALDEEDDIDLALQHMHKETPTAEITAQEETESATKGSNVSTADNNKTEDKMDVDQVNIDTDIVIKKEAQPEIKQEDVTDSADQEFIEESPIKNDKTATDDVHLETDSIRKSLIDDLIAEADNAKTVLDGGVTDEDETTVVSIDKEATKEDVVEDKASEEIEDAAEVKTDAHSEPTESKSESTESKIENAISTEEAIPEESTASELVEQKPATSSENTSGEIVSGNSADKVKSIISEWAEEDDDVDDDDDKVKEEL